MAYMSQEHKKEIMGNVKPLLKEYGLKGSFAVENHSTIVLTISKGRFNIGENYHNVNPYWVAEHYEGEMKEALSKIVKAMHGERYYDNSDVQSDYFDVSHYVTVQFGKYNKPYVYDPSIKKG